MFPFAEAGPQLGDGQEIGTWQNPEGMWGSHSTASTDIIVDTRDKEAWPSIGDQSESASNSDNATSDNDKSSSVISSSSSSNPGQPVAGQSPGDSSSSGSIKGSSASNVWGATYNPGEEKMDSSAAAWGINPSGFSQMNSGPWANASLNNSAVNNHMQSNPSSGGDSGPLTSSAPINSSLGWGINTAGLTSSNRPQGMEPGKRDGMMPSSGAQTANNGPTLDGGIPSSMANAMSWPGINFSSAGLPGLGKEQAATPQDTAWGGVSAGNSVIGSGLGGVSSTAGPNNSMIDNKNRMDQWGSPSAAGWGSLPDSIKSDGSGWGSPTASPLPNAGTESWGQPDNKPIPQAWTSEPNFSKSNPSTGPGWGQAPPDIRPGSAGGWNQSPDVKQNPSPGWGDNSNKPSPPSWDMPDKNVPKSSVWGQMSDSRGPPPPSQWGSGAGAANPPPQWGGNNNGVGAAGVNPPGGDNPAAAWGGNQMDRGPNGRPSGPNGPPPGSSWGQPPKDHPSQPPSPSMGSTLEYNTSVKDQMLLEVINSTEGWGKRPIRQDKSWDMEAASPPTRRKSLSSDESNHWNQQNNNGTAIWESSMAPKDCSGGPQGGGPQGGQWAGDDRSRGASRGSGAEWGSDNDSGTWNGPPDHKPSNQWNGPSHGQWGGPGGGGPGGGGGGGGSGGYQGNNQSNTWGGGNDRRENQWGGNNGHPGHQGGGGGHPNNQWGGPKRDDGNQWGASKDDNVWDKDGTNAWSQGSGGNRSMETGMWGDGGHPRRRGSSSSWDEMEPSGWEDPSPSQSRRTPNSMDDGAAFWGGPQEHGRPIPWDRLQGPPNTSMPPPHMQPPMGRGGPRGPPPDDKTPGMWGQPRQPSNKSGWGEPAGPDGIDTGTSIWGQGTQQVRGRHVSTPLYHQLTRYGRLGCFNLITRS